MTSSRPTRSAPSRARRARLLFGVIAATALAVGCGSDTGSEPDREYVVDLHIEDSAEEYEYIPDEPFDVRVGDRVTFRITNTGALPHDVQVVDPNGTRIATGPVTDPGGVIETVVMFEEPGIYQLNCLVDDHLTAHGMQALIRADDVTS